MPEISSEPEVSHSAAAREHSKEGRCTAQTYCDFEAELANARTAKPKGSLSAEQVFWRRHFPDAPTEEAFRKHRHSHGGEGIAEVAGSYDLKTAAREARRLAPKVKRNRRTNAELLAQVLDLPEPG